jgi:hypothetical protein
MTEMLVILLAVYGVTRLVLDIVDIIWPVR